jgi:DNA-binding GntR family transcriptional regulator
MVKVPAYLRIAAMLRGEIASGRFGPGAKLPSETQLMMRHHVSRSVAKWAVAVLKADGLVDGRQGAGVFVRTPRRIARHIPPTAAPAGERARRSPADGAGQVDPWSGQSEEISADVTIARRLAVQPGEPVCRTTCLHLAEGIPMQLVTSWRRAGSDPTETGADEVCERIVVRPASPDEIAALAMPGRGMVFAITRTQTARGVPVEIADIVIPGERCELVYQLPIR